MDQFTRIKKLLGLEAFARLQQSRVTVVGVGAVGGYAVEGLVRAGVGALQLIDSDHVEESNLNRQIHALHSTLGRAKVEVARARVVDINPACDVTACQLHIHKGNAGQAWQNSPHLIIDAIDSLDDKVALLSRGWQQGIPLLSAMGAALRRDPTQVRLADLMESRGCPLARRVRKALRRAGVDRGIRCVYSEEQVDFAGQHHGELEPGHNPLQPRPLGSLPTVTAIFGLYLANEAIRLLSSPPGPGSKG